MFPKNLDSPPRLTNSTRKQTERANPDVVFQFSWGNSLGYEQGAINDMLDRALVVPHQPSSEAPKLGFLVNVAAIAAAMVEERCYVLTYSESLAAQQSLMRKPTALEPARHRTYQDRKMPWWKLRPRIWALKVFGLCFAVLRSRFRQEKSSSYWNSTAPVDCRSIKFWGPQLFSEASRWQTRSRGRVGA
eukprot:scaffold374_cov160-Amphora_coffeaeformis.AAC.13